MLYLSSTVTNGRFKNLHKKYNLDVLFSVVWNLCCTFHSKSTIEDNCTKNYSMRFPCLKYPFVNGTHFLIHFGFNSLKKLWATLLLMLCFPDFSFSSFNSGFFVFVCLMKCLIVLYSFIAWEKGYVNILRYSY